MTRHGEPDVPLRVAAIDVGSNTVRAIAASLLPDRTLLRLHEATRMTALGRGLSVTGRLDGRAVAQTARFIAGFIQECGPLDSVYCVGTAAARDAANAGHLRAILQYRAGVDLEIISPSVEARMSFVGALATVPPDLRVGGVCVVDVGGRSTELAMRRGRSMRTRTARIGARALTEACVQSDPPSRSDLGAARRAAQTALADAVALLGSADRLLAVGGTACSAAVLGCDAWHMSLSRLRRIRRGLSVLKLADRRKIMRFDPRRAEIICAGLIILEVLAKHAPERRLHISTGGVREGVLIHRTGARGIVAAEPVSAAP
jgi:exopolyphosphatase/guanosine-5'-triphosphate,3'-diphosphate pyrophosphatase